MDGVNVKTFGPVRVGVPGTTPEFPLTVITFAIEAVVESALLNVTTTDALLGTWIAPLAGLMLTIWGGVRSTVVK